MYEADPHKDSEIPASHREVIRRLVAGQKAKDVAQSLGISPEQVSRIRHTEAGNEYLNHLQWEIDKLFVKMHSAALIERMSLARSRGR